MITEDISVTLVKTAIGNLQPEGVSDEFFEIIVYAVITLAAVFVVSVVLAVVIKAVKHK